MPAGARFPDPAGYDGTGPDPAEGLRQALALATDGELRRTMAMLVMGAKTLAGADPDERITSELTGSAALFGWLAAVVTAEADRRSVLFEALGREG